MPYPYYMRHQFDPLIRVCKFRYYLIQNWFWHINPTQRCLHLARILHNFGKRIKFIKYRPDRGCCIHLSPVFRKSDEGEEANRIMVYRCQEILWKYNIYIEKYNFFFNTQEKDKWGYKSFVIRIIGFVFRIYWYYL